MANIYSAQSGLWSDRTTWQGGNVPSVNDDVYISNGHTVTFNVIHDNNYYVNSVKILSGGTLYASRVVNSCLITRANSNAIYIYSGGRFDYGSKDDYIPKDITAKVFSRGTGDNHVFINCTSGSQATICGSPEYYGNLYRTSLYANVTNSNVIRVRGNASSWKAGQELVIYRNLNTAYTSYSGELSKVTVVSNGGYNQVDDYTTITISPAITAYSGAYSLIVNISRNVEIGKFNYQGGAYQYNSNRPTVILDLCKNLLCKDMSFVGCYVVQAPGMGALNVLGEQRIERCVVRNCYYSFYIRPPHNNVTSNFIIKNIVTFSSYFGHWDAARALNEKYVEDSIFIGCFYSARHISAKNCVFYCNFAPLLNADYKIIDCDMVCNHSMTYNSYSVDDKSLCYNNIAIKLNSLFALQSTKSRFEKCYFGYDRNMQLYDYNYGYFEYHTDSYCLNKVFFKNCYFSRWPLTAINNSFPAGNRNGQCYFVSYNHNNVPGDHRIMSYMCDLLRVTDIKMVHSQDSIKVVPYNSFQTYNIFSEILYDVVEYDVEPGEHIRKIHFICHGFDSGRAVNSSNVILEAEYIDLNGNKVIASSQIYDDYSNWEGISGNKKVATVIFRTRQKQNIKYKFKWGCFYVNSYAFVDTKIYRSCGNGRRLLPLNIVWTEQGLESHEKYINKVL